MSILKSEPSEASLKSLFFSFLRQATFAVLLFVALFSEKPVFAQHEIDVESSGNIVQTLSVSGATQRSNIRVGFVDNDDPFSAIDENGVKSGYAYEYLQYVGRVS